MGETTIDLDNIENDDFFKQFLDPDDKQSDVKNLLTVAQQLKKLEQALQVLDAELHNQVLANHEELLSQVTWVEKIEGVLGVMQSHVQSLLSAVEHLRGKIIEPFNRIEEQTIILQRLHETLDLVRRVGRVQHLVHSQKLEAQINNNNNNSCEISCDIIKAAKSINELEELMSDTDLNGLDIIIKDHQTVKNVKLSIQKIATNALTQGLYQSDSSKVSMAIKVFENLEILKIAVEKVEAMSIQDIEKTANQALDVSLLSSSVSQDLIKRGGGGGGPGRATLPSPGTSGNIRTELWENVDKLFQETVYTQCVQIELLERILLEHHTKEFDGFSHNFWKIVTEKLSKILIERSQASSLVKQALEGEYPKFLRVFLDLKKRLKERLEAIGTYTIGRDILQPFENAYLSRSISRLLDPVHTMFSLGGGGGSELTPNQDDIDGLIRTITSELSVSLVDESLSIIVAKNVGKAIRLFCLKCEQSVVTGGEASQVIDTQTPGQQINVNIANIIYYLASQTSRVVTNLAGSLSTEGASIISTALEEINNLTKNIITPIISSINDAIESIILTMHDDCEFRDTSSPLGREISCSLYMRELQAFILRSVTTFIAPFKNQIVVGDCCNIVASRCIELFVRHACLIRPLSSYGRAKLIVDFGQMEIALGPLCRGGQFGLVEQQQYRLLRAFKALLPLGSDKIVDKIIEMKGEGGVPASLVLLHLFSGAPPELQSPHQSAGWSINRLSQWMDDHPSEKDRLALSSGPLQRYETIIRQKNIPSFHPLFPLMTKLANMPQQSTN